MKRTHHFLMAMVFMAMLAGCTSHWANTSTDFEAGCWNASDTLSLEFENQDTGQVFVLGFPLVVSEDYPFHNIYLRATLKAPSGDETMIPGEFVLADPTGQWLSEPSGDLVTFQLNVGDGIRFNQKGKYLVRLQHYMRDAQLCGVVRAGISLDKM